MSFLDLDLPVCFADWGEVMSFNSPTNGIETGNVIFDQPDKSLKLGGMGGVNVMSNDPMVLFVTAQFPDLVPQSPVLINGVQYVVRSVMKLADGRVSQATLRNP